MKKMRKLSVLFTAAAALSLLAFVSCDGGNKASDDDSEITNNLSKSSGTNEVSGKSFDYGAASLNFNADGTATIGTGSEIRAAEGSFTYKYNYSWDEENKTIEIQLTDTAAGGTYEEASAYVKKEFDKLKAGVVDGVMSNDYFTAMETAQADFVKGIKGIVGEKLEDYIEAERTVYEKYLYNIYSSVATFKYEISEEGELSLELQAPSDLNNAYAFYWDAIASFNDSSSYSLPFVLTAADADYTGVPDITVKDSKSGSATVKLYKYYVESLDDDDIAEQIEYMAEDMGTQVLSVFSDQKKLTAIMTELVTSKYAESKTLADAMDEVVNSMNVSFDYTFDIQEDSATVDIKFTDKGNLGDAIEDKLSLVWFDYFETLFSADEE